MVRAFLPRMERVGNGSGYQMSFPAFYFTGHGQNLFVHCTVLACVGADTSLCQPDDGVRSAHIPQLHPRLAELDGGGGGLWRDWE